MGYHTRFSFAIVAFAAVLVLSSATQPSGEPSSLVSRAQAVGDPVASIAWLPSEVSNDSLVSLDGSNSYDSDGYIANYTWRVEISNVSTFLWGQTEIYMFKILGLYRITLTVTDNNGSSGSAFSAVYSIVDVDRDDLPDWWEKEYFWNMEEIASDDYDNDGYTNLEEYASGQNPTVQNSHPGLVQDLRDNWMYVVIICVAIAVATFLVWFQLKKKRKEEERKKIEFALEMEKALQGEK